ncbi:hypothetical protein B0F90DRAFT_880987 [Multifurca ochricompacta]|uniref:PEHE domain-containing protein n=1 Tax=Multifurca ochricompacta TaxID=376703 RepID=A0AAD4QM13_9AGAM|nr:hypothetical protein B0F90DRAFT_880987 [Multifurca ochricompacta]
MPRRASASTTTLPAVAATTVSGTATNSTTAATAATAGGPQTESSSVVPSSQAGLSAASTSNPGGATRPRRIMPSRSRRGGPGVGTSDVDTQILETLRRRRENDPLIPAHTRLLLTTYSSRVRTIGEDAAGTDGSHFNTSAYERYFDKPEVIRAYREQQLIQTPEFTLLSEHEAVGGRFRPRSLDDVRALSYFLFLPPPRCQTSSPPFFLVQSDAACSQEGIDTSDAAYEKRHRKYEAFEKRQRLREKEKLKHEHYKLKERIEQLRALENPAFLNVPDSFFASSLRPSSQEGESDSRGGKDGLAPSHNEGEWRKRQMLDVANNLEARYRTLLDTVPSRVPEPPAPTSTPTPIPIPTILPLQTPSHTPVVAVRRSPASVSPIARWRREGTRVDKSRTYTTSTNPHAPRNGRDSKAAYQVPDPFASIDTRTRNCTALVILPKGTAAVGIAGGMSANTSAVASPSPTRPRPKPIFKNPAEPGPYARVSFAKRMPLQDAAAMCVGASAPPTPTPTPSAAAVAASPSPSAPPTVPVTTAAPSAVATPALAPVPRPSSPVPPPATHPTLRRRPPRAAAAAASTPPQPPPARAHGTSQPRKRRRVGLSEEEEESLGSDTDNNEVGGVGVSGAAEGAERGVATTEGAGAGAVATSRQDEGAADEEREQQPARWRESALYREAQRHAGAPSARKTHRHLGIFGLRGFPAEIEHIRDFMLPVWVIPRDDPRLVSWDKDQSRNRGQGSGSGQGRGPGGVVRGAADRVRGGGNAGEGGGPGPGPGEVERWKLVEGKSKIQWR